ncbi:type IV toxin-antitoxin system AbiEi family antitoxin domain-containing protein [Streptomyces hirsutus]|uniref:Type IV toxin-antitoxin system AbiEi family antitoxin domain-containing protein n=1 Tax=Streptomyces hirsutus TaxID=35620 RepID=A0ABZ1GJL8_9ACTN|nr:type IV toxin-antitoxin system AbiEi family antitoxin domain-containing protein [Streptomyces hirsutus]WSD06359.1 type IV toxin-antitoxin system AbiEi family antitoxin domain-containing protein [Streptomyces hirsutus]WTD20230.1 type IV toxin-antitoxin system AbiEi family antitoxin domain-containing protein [Streptomyces hirsutus]WTD74844.1 type IV toxin-antitoxin system AbiEi family antitoxin domain-containing protein [Streptomyces sp. NBC_01635]
MAVDQWGLVTAAQARGLGVSGVQLMRLTEAGLLESVGRGVYALPAVGLPRHLEIKVAWLRLQARVPAWDRPLGSRDSGVVSHTSACQLHDLGDIPAPDVEISVPRRRTTTEPFVRLRTACLGAADITVVDGLPVTTAARTIVDLLHTKADGGHVGGVIADAERRDLVDIDALADAVQPHARKYGLPAAATGHELIEHLVGQAGRTLHFQEVARAGEEGIAIGAQLGVLTRYLDAGKPFREALAGEAYASLFRAIAAQQLENRTALEGAMPRFLPVLRALQQETPSPFARALKDAMPASGLGEAFQRAALPDSVSPALRTPAVLSPETQRALWGATVSGTAMDRAVRALQQLEAVSPGSVEKPDEEDAATPDGEPKELEDKQVPD